MRRHIYVASGLAVLAIAASAAIAQHRYAPTWDGVPVDTNNWSVFDGEGKLLERHGNGPLKPRPRIARPRDDAVWWQELTLVDIAPGKAFESPEPGRLHVQARADTNIPPRHRDEQCRPPSYFWTLKVLRMAPTEADIHHMEQAFYLEYRGGVWEEAYGKRSQHEFSQWLPLEPGRYLVSVGLPEHRIQDDGSLRSTQADGSLAGNLSSFWAVVR